MQQEPTENEGLLLASTTTYLSSAGCQNTYSNCRLLAKLADISPHLWLHIPAASHNNASLISKRKLTHQTIQYFCYNSEYDCQIMFLWQAQSAATNYRKKENPQKKKISYAGIP